MDTIDIYFKDYERQFDIKSMFKQMKVYSDPMATAFGTLHEGPNRKKLRVFDFDDTLVKVKANITVKNNESEKTLTPAEFAVYEPKPGDVFNFKEFNAMIKAGTPINKNIDLLKVAASDRTTKTTILTARMLGFPPKNYLKKKFGLDVYVVALGDANPQKKADWIEKQILKGYNDILFVDDSIKNIQAVDKLKQKYPTITLKTVHTTEAHKIDI
jgi:hypothetical protein